MECVYLKKGNFVEEEEEEEEGGGLNDGDAVQVM
jgi:hypothetical protein